jgi:hypothetical protein
MPILDPCQIKRVNDLVIPSSHTTTIINVSTDINYKHATLLLFAFGLLPARHDGPLVISWPAQPQPGRKQPWQTAFEISTHHHCLLRCLRRLLLRCRLRDMPIGLQVPWPDSPIRFYTAPGLPVLSQACRRILPWPFRLPQDRLFLGTFAA